jgi:four helix bundle protein
MKHDNLKLRTRKFALAVIMLVEKLPRDQTLTIIGKQILRSGTSVGANYRAACRAKSVKDFIAKMGIVEEEIDETIYWLELMEESGKILTGNRLRP